MTKWLTDPQNGLRVGVALLVAVLLVDASLITWAASHPPNIWTFVAAFLFLCSLLFVGVLTYWLNGLVQSGYILDRNSLTIIWGPNEQVIPTPQIERVLLGEEIEGHIHFRGVRWPGHWRGYGQIEGLGPTLFYATVPPRQQIFIVTPGLTYGISPEEPQAFLQTLRSRIEMGPTQLVEAASSGPAFLQWDFWRDRLGLALLAGALTAVVALFALLSARFPALPRSLPLHFDAKGAPDVLAPQGQIFFLPLIGLLVLLANGILGGLLYRRERLLAYLLWSGAAVIQILLWVAVMGILATV